MHNSEPSLFLQPGETVKNKEQDPIDKGFEDLDIDVIPDVGRGPILPPSFFIGEEEWEGSIARIDGGDIGKNWGTSAVSQEEMDAQLYEDLDKEPPSVIFLLPRGAIEDLWIIPGLTFGSQTFKTMDPEFEPCIDLCNAPSWPDLALLPASPMRAFRSAAEQPSESSIKCDSVNGGKPSSTKHSDEDRGPEGQKSDAETTFSRGSRSRSHLPSDKPEFDAPRQACSSPIRARRPRESIRKPKRFLPPSPTSNEVKEVEKPKKTKQKGLQKENQANAEVKVKPVKKRGRRPRSTI